MNAKQARIRVLELAAADLEAHVDSGSDLITCDLHTGDGSGEDTTQPCDDCGRIVAQWRRLIALLRRKGART